LSGSRKRIVELYDLKKTRRVAWHEIAPLPGSDDTFLNLNTPAEFQAVTDALTS